MWNQALDKDWTEYSYTNIEIRSIRCAHEWRDNTILEPVKNFGLGSNESLESPESKTIFFFQILEAARSGLA